MRIDIITTQARTTTQVDHFWRSHGWQPHYWDNTGHPLGQGRNRVLADFYSSDREWLVLADDDMTIDVARGRGQEFLAAPQALLSRVPQDISSFGLMNNIHHRVDITLTNPAVRDHWCFYRASWIGCLFFHRRTSGQFQFHPWDVLEDMDWCLDQIQAGQHVATCMNMVMKNLGLRSTIFTDQADRRRRYQAARQRIASTYPGITITPTGKLVKTRFLNQYWRPDPAWSSVPGIGPCRRIAI